MSAAIQVTEGQHGDGLPRTRGYESGNGEYREWRQAGIPVDTDRRSAEDASGVAARRGNPVFPPQREFRYHRVSMCPGGRRHSVTPAQPASAQAARFGAPLEPGPSPTKGEAH